MSDKIEKILIKRYASRRLYNTNTSDYLTLEEVSNLIQQGHEVQILDRKTGDDLTRQFLLQIITEHETKGNKTLPVNVLTDIVRSYGEVADSLIPDFLSQSYATLKEQQSSVIEKIQSAIPTPFDPSTMFGDPMGWQAKQKDLLDKMMKPFIPAQFEPETDFTTDAPADEPVVEPVREEMPTSDVDDIKRQLADLQDKLSKL